MRRCSHCISFMCLCLQSHFSRYLPGYFYSVFTWSILTLKSCCLPSHLPDSLPGNYGTLHRSFTLLFMPLTWSCVIVYIFVHRTYDHLVTSVLLTYCSFSVFCFEGFSEELFVATVSVLLFPTSTVTFSTFSLMSFF